MTVIVRLFTLLLCSFVRSFGSLSVRSFVRFVLRSFVRSFVRCYGRSNDVSSSIVPPFLRSPVPPFLRCFVLSLSSNKCHLVVSSSLLPLVLCRCRCLYGVLLSYTTHCVVLPVNVRHHLQQRFHCRCRSLRAVFVRCCGVV